MTWCLDYWYLKNQFIYERNILVLFGAGREEIFWNSGNQNEPLYFVKVTEKGTAQKILLTHTVTSLVMVKGFWKDFIWNCQDRSTLAKKIQLLPTPIIFAPDEVFDTYIEITEDLYLDAQHFKLLIQKANSYM